MISAPCVVLRDEALGLELRVSLEELLRMQEVARATMAQALGADRGLAEMARESVEQVFQAALTPGSAQLGATISAHLLKHEFDLETGRRQARAAQPAVPPPAQTVDAPAEEAVAEPAKRAAPAPCPASVSGMGAEGHPDEVPCELCAARVAAARPARQARQARPQRGA